MSFIKLLAGISIVSGAFLIGDAIPVSSQREILESLRTVASIVFGVVGAWIALVYPKALEELLKSDAPAHTIQESNIRRLLRPLLYSTVVLAFTLAFDLLFITAKNFAVAPETAGMIRRLSFSITAGMTILQLWSLALTLGPTDSVRQELRLLQKRKEYVDQLLSRSDKDSDSGQ